ncbi:MAG: DNA polymerase [Limnohabitans sp.]
MTEHAAIKLGGPSVSVFENPPELDKTQSTFWVGSGDFVDDGAPASGSAKRKSLTADPYLIIGFDTEFKTPDYHITKDHIVTGGAKYRVLSYQFHAKTLDGKEWQGICCTDGDERMSIPDFLIFVLGKGARDHGITELPTTIFLVGHFTRADIPAFADFKSQTQFLSSVRNTFLSIDHYLTIPLKHGDEQIANLRVVIRDTMLLTPQATKSLRGIGELVGFPKLQLDPDPKIHKQLIEQMDVVRRERWHIYREYALMDATICVRYIERIIQQYEAVTGKQKVPVTLTSIGVDLLLKSWAEDLHLNHLSVLGKEQVKQKVFNKQKNYFVTKKVEVDVEELSHLIPFITECYHGGRNEQYWFGPGFKDDWIDIDLASAYPTAMSLIGMPDWRAITESKRVDDFTPTTLGFAWVDFKFPTSTRYPTMPVRSDNGLIFPLEGTSYCSAPEIFTARQLGCQIKIRKGVIVPTNPEIKIFGEFIKECIKKRQKAGSKTLEGLFWKEISNSTYGKTAQGLRKKRVYDMRDRDTKPLPPSRITNPCFAAFITSFVRAVLGEIINSIPQEAVVFSCTTDGFITNIPEADIPKISGGPLATIYAKARQDLVGDPKMLEIKHAIRQPLGWRTRGQATLKQHTHLADDETGIVLAKGGIFTKPESETDEQQNKEIIDLFFNRTPTSMVLVESLTGVRDIVEHDADLVPKEINKRLSMEYDWKRQPIEVSMCKEYNHVYFSTRPWKNVDQFKTVRDLWDEFTKGSPKCIKDLNDFNAFADHIECKGLAPEKSKYLRREKPDTHRLRQSLCEAWQHSEAGVVKDPKMTARQFAELLESMGIPCKRADVENGKKKPFQPNACPPTDNVRQLLQQLKKHFPKLKVSQFLIQTKSRDAVTIRPK